MVRILGISAFYHDSAAALLVNGRIVAAAQEERFTRKKHDARFPSNAIDYCISAAGCHLSDVDHVVFYEKPFIKFERLLETYVAFAPRGFRSFQKAIPIWLKEKLFQKHLLCKELSKKAPKITWHERLLFTEHHHSHAASAFFPSPFEEAVVLTLDGVGEWSTASVAIGSGNDISIEKEIHFPHSLGLLYSAFTYYLGFQVNSGEYKVMGLAPYGEPRYKNLILDNVLDLKSDGSFHLDQSYFDYCTGLHMTNRRFCTLFGRPARKADSEPLEQFHMDVAASVQAVTEEAMLRLTRSLADEYDIPNLTLAGGVALNCVGNGKILRDRQFENVWVQPAAGDAGGAVGAALVVWHEHLEQPRVPSSSDAMEGSFLGPEFDQIDIEHRLRNAGANFDILQEDRLLEETAQALSDQKVVGWFQGRMEFGPRALGGRSILADPRSPSMQQTLNFKIKFRESFRPFAPSILREHLTNWFDIDVDTPYMLMVAPVTHNRRRAITETDEERLGTDRLNRPRSDIPAVTHVDHSARIQTIHHETNPLYYSLVTRFYELTGCPMVVNTSFNVRGEPIVCTPEDAFRCFMGTNMDIMVIGHCLLSKDLQNPDLAQDYRDAFAPD